MCSHIIKLGLSANVYILQNVYWSISLLSVLMLLSHSDNNLPRTCSRSTSSTFRARRGKDVGMRLLHYTLSRTPQNMRWKILDCPAF